MSAKKTELLTLKQAVDFLNELHGIDPEKVGRNAYGTQHLYNMIHNGKLNRHGPRHIVQIEKDQLVNLLGPKKATG